MIFEPTVELPPSATLVSANRSCFMMLKPVGSELRLSVASSDLLDKTPLLLVLRGNWELAGSGGVSATATAVVDRTRVQIPYKDYMPINVIFKSSRASSSVPRLR